jgi:hypothetical protein
VGEAGMGRAVRLREGPPRAGCALTVMTLAGDWWRREVPRAGLPQGVPEEPYARFRRLRTEAEAAAEADAPAVSDVEPMRRVDGYSDMPKPVADLLRRARVAGWAGSAWRASATVQARRKSAADGRMRLTAVRQETWSVRMGRDGVRMALVRTQPDGKWGTGIIAGATVPVLADVTVTEAGRLLAAADVAAERDAIAVAREALVTRARLLKLVLRKCSAVREPGHVKHVWETGAPEWVHRVCDPAVGVARKRTESGG